jgi:hypothetical protein
MDESFSSFGALSNTKSLKRAATGIPTIKYSTLRDLFKELMCLKKWFKENLPPAKWKVSDEIAFIENFKPYLTDSGAFLTDEKARGEAIELAIQRIVSQERF